MDNNKGKLGSLFERFVMANIRMMSKYYLLVLLIAGVITYVMLEGIINGFWGLSRPMELRPDLTELLPETQPSVEGLEEILNKYGSEGYLMLAIETNEDEEDLIEFYKEQEDKPLGYQQKLFDDYYLRLDQYTGQVQRILKGRFYRSIRTLREDRIFTYALSPDERFIVTAGEEGDAYRKYITLWDRQNQTHRNQFDPVPTEFAGRPSILPQLEEEETSEGAFSAFFTGTVELFEHTEDITFLTFSPSGRIVASASTDDQVILWDIYTNDFAKQTLSDDITALAFHPTEDILAVGSKNGDIMLWKIRTDEWIYLGSHIRQEIETEDIIDKPYPISTLAFSHNGNFLLSGGEDNVVRYWDISIPEIPLLENSAHLELITAAAITPDDTLAVSGDKSGIVVLWDLETGITEALEMGQREVTQIKISPSGHLAAIASKDKNVYLLNLQSKEFQTLSEHSSWVTSIDFSSDGLYLVSGGNDNHVILYDTVDYTPHIMDDHTSRVIGVDFIEGNNTVVSASFDNTIREWNFSSEQIQTYPEEIPYFTNLILSNNDRYLIAAKNTGGMSFWNINNQMNKEYEKHNSPVTAMAFSPDSNYVVSGSEDGEIKVWDYWDSRERISRGAIHQLHSPITALSFSMNNQFIAAADKSGNIILWNHLNDEVIHPGNPNIGHQSEVSKIQFFSSADSPDHPIGVITAGRDDSRVIVWKAFEDTNSFMDIVTGQSGINDFAINTIQNKIYIAGVDGSIKIYQLSDLSLSRTITDHTQAVLDLEISKDATVLVSASADGEVIYYQIGEGFNRIKMPEEEKHQGPVNSIALSDNGEIVLSGSSDGTVKLWEPFGGVEGTGYVKTMEGHTAPVVQVVLTSDGRYASSVSQDNTFKLWNVHIEREIEEPLETRIAGVKQITTKSSLADRDKVYWEAPLMRSKEFTDYLARRLETMTMEFDGKIIEPFSYVEYKKPVEFFDESYGFFIDYEDLVDLYDRIKRQLDFESELVSGISLTEIKPEELDVEDLLDEYVGDTGSQYLSTEGMYKSTNNKMLVILAKPSLRSIDMAASEAIYQAVKELEADIVPQSFHKSIVLRYAGRLKRRIDSTAVLNADLARTGILALTFLVTVIILNFRRLSSIFLIAVPLVLTVVWTFGTVTLIWGYINILTGFLASILMGLGIDYGIHFFSRYLEERVDGKDQQMAGFLTLFETGKATLASALTTIAAFLCITFTEFKGFAEFGYIGAFGIAYAFIMMFYVFTSMAFLLERIKLLRKPDKPMRRIFKNLNLTPNFAKYKWVFLGIIGAFTLFSIIVASEVGFEYNFRRLEGLNLEPYEVEAKISDLFNINLGPAIVMCNTIEEEKEVLDALNVMKNIEIEDETVEVLDQFIEGRDRDDDFYENLVEIIEPLNHLKELLWYKQEIQQRYPQVDEERAEYEKELEFEKQYLINIYQEHLEATGSDENIEDISRADLSITRLHAVERTQRMIQKYERKLVQLKEFEENYEEYLQQTNQEIEETISQIQETYGETTGNILITVVENQIESAEEKYLLDTGEGEEQWTENLELFNQNEGAAAVPVSEIETIGQFEAHFGSKITIDYIYGALYKSLDITAGECSDVTIEMVLDRGKLSTIDLVDTIDKWVPENQEDKRDVLEDINELFHSKEQILVDVGAGELLDVVDEFTKDPESIERSELPWEIVRQFKGYYKDEDGIMQTSSEIFVQIFPFADMDDGRNIKKFTREVTHITTSSGRRLAAAGENLVMADILYLLEADGPWIIFLAVIATIIILIFSFRSLKGVLIAFIPLAVGILWVFGIMYLLDIRFNILNVITIPIIIGIGIDNGVHLYHRYLSEGTGCIPYVMRTTGVVIFMASFTDFLGFSSLLSAHHQGLNSIGALAVIGIGSTFILAYFGIPSLLAVIESFKAKKDPEVQKAIEKGKKVIGEKYL